MENDEYFRLDLRKYIGGRRREEVEEIFGDGGRRSRRRREEVEEIRGDGGRRLRCWVFF